MCQAKAKVRLTYLLVEVCFRYGSCEKAEDLFEVGERSEKDPRSFGQ